MGVTEEEDVWCEGGMRFKRLSDDGDVRVEAEDTAPPAGTILRVPPLAELSSVALIMLLTCSMVSTYFRARSLCFDRSRKTIKMSSFSLDVEAMF